MKILKYIPSIIIGTLLVIIVSTALAVATVGILKVISLYTDNKERIYDLEIYTYNDIIYINHLCVTFESRPVKKCFNTNDELKEYVSDLTVDHVLEHRKELLNEF